jgi:hypothetical protein
MFETLQAYRSAYRIADFRISPDSEACAEAVKRPGCLDIDPPLLSTFLRPNRPAKELGRRWSHLRKPQSPTMPFGAAKLG